MGWRTVIIDSRCIGGLKGLNDNSIAFIEEGNRIELNKDGIVVIDFKLFFTSVEYSLIVLSLDAAAKYQVFGLNTML